MKIQIASDLHLEFIQSVFPGERIISPAADADMLILAGDIASGPGAIQTFADWPVPVLYVPGNHEFYGRHREQTLKFMKDAARKGVVTLLDGAAADFRRFGSWYDKHRDELRRLRVLGTTLWTDYRLPNLNRTQRQQMEVAQTNLADHRSIRTDRGLFTPEDAFRLHEQDRKWLETQLVAPFDGKTVVITHHGPHQDSTHPRWAGNSLNGAFMSHLPELVEQADLWVHGHVHDTVQYRAGKCHVVANPRGYGMSLRSVSNVSDLLWENPAFQPALVFEI